MGIIGKPSMEASLLQGKDSSPNTTSILNRVRMCCNPPYLAVRMPSYEWSWPMNPSLGLMQLRRLLTRFLDSARVIWYSFIMYAITCQYTACTQVMLIITHTLYIVHVHVCVRILCSHTTFTYLVCLCEYVCQCMYVSLDTGCVGRVGMPQKDPPLPVLKAVHAYPCLVWVSEVGFLS